MCLAVVAWRVAARYRLLLAANRDERHDRPTASAAWWQDLPDVLGGYVFQNQFGVWRICYHGNGKNDVVVTYLAHGPATYVVTDAGD